MPPVSEERTIADARRQGDGSECVDGGRAGGAEEEVPQAVGSGEHERHHDHHDRGDDHRPPRVPGHGSLLIVRAPPARRASASRPSRCMPAACRGPSFGNVTGSGRGSARRRVPAGMGRAGGWPARPERRLAAMIDRPRRLVRLVAPRLAQLAGVLARRHRRRSHGLRVPEGLGGVPQLHRAHDRDRQRRRRPPGHRQGVLDRQELQGPRAVGGQGLGQRQRRRARARGPVRRRHALRRAHGGRDDPPHLPLARRRLRRRPADHEHRQQPRDLDRVHGQPGRRRVRHLGRHASTSGARTASRRRGRARSGPTSTGTTATSGAAAAGRARTRRRSPTAARVRSRRPRTARCATSWPAGSSTVGSRSGWRSRSTSTGAW